MAMAGFFLAFDLPFLVANTFKFLDGGYLPFAVGALFVLLMVDWRVGRGLLGLHFRERAEPLDRLRLLDRDTGEQIAHDGGAARGRGLALGSALARGERVGERRVVAPRPRRARALGGVDRHAGRDAGGEAVGLALAAEARQGLDEREERVLDHVLELRVRAAEHAGHRATDPRSHGLQGPLHGGDVARRRGARERVRRQDGDLERRERGGGGER
jgi:hypothetical protein